jgi:hypothetical protein
LTKLRSIKLFATAIATPPEINFGRGVLHGDLQTLHYHQDDMHMLTSKVPEVIAFPNWLSVKQNMQKLLSLESVLYSHIWTLETNTSNAQEFLKICRLVEQAIRNNLSFESVV